MLANFDFLYQEKKMTTANRKITASSIHNGKRFLPQGTCIEVAPDGTIVSIHPKELNEKVEHFEGIITPGFVNTHCHLELAHLKNVVPEGTGLIPFLQAIPARRNDFTDTQKSTARLHAYYEMIQNGIVAVGDIANTTETLDIRVLGGMHFHTFVECIGFTAAAATSRLAYSVEVKNCFATQKVKGKILHQSVIPHAPYSVSGALFQLINELNPEGILSIHNQESKAEDEFYQDKTGAVRDLLAGLGVDDAFFQPTGKSSLQSYLPWLSATHRVMLVHNTFTSADDAAFANQHIQDLFWCLCPNANLYIEGVLPDVAMLSKHSENICIGTDSLASNHQLSVLAELIALKQHFEFLDWETLLCWGTMNGARALGMDETIGSIEVGKKPGIIQIPDLEKDAVVRIL